MYEGILLELPLAKFFLKKMRGAYCDLNDLPSLDPELYRHLVKLRHYTAEQLSELCLTFVVTDDVMDVMGRPQEVCRGPRCSWPVGRSVAGHCTEAASTSTLCRRTFVFLQSLHVVFPYLILYTLGVVLSMSVLTSCATGVLKVELKPGGHDIPVTQENVIQYINKVADYRLNKQPLHAIAAFMQGFYDLIDPQWVSMFHAAELQMLISGSEAGLDLQDLKAHVEYTGKDLLLD